MGGRDPKSSLVRILREDGVPEGAGILVSERHVITCFHVVEPLIRSLRDDVWIDFPLVKENRTVSTRIAEKFEVSPKAAVGEPEDICILKIAPDAQLPEDTAPASFYRSEADFYGLEVKMCGFPAGMEDGDLGDWTEGRLKDLTGRGWVQMDPDLTSRDVAPGYSGTAVWDKYKNIVVGMVVSINTRDNITSGYMIPVPVLAEAWPEIGSPENPDVGVLASKCCNREKQDVQFRNFFVKNCSECPDAPRFFFINGKRGDSHLSLIERFQHTRIAASVAAGSGAGVGVAQYVLLKEAPWPSDGDFEVQQSVLKENIISAFAPGCRNEYAFLPDVCRQLGLDQRYRILLVHDIRRSAWNSRMSKLLKWYMEDYWHLEECREDMPLFLIFFNFIFEPLSKMTFLERMQWRLKNRSAIHRKLSALVPPSEENGISGKLLLDKLQKIERKDVDNWFAKHGYNKKLKEKEREDRMDALFKGRKNIRMYEVEDFLEDIVSGVSRKMSEEQRRKI